MANIIVFGATGKTGQRVVQAALEAEHAVTAFGRSAKARFAQSDATAFKGDALEAEDVLEAMKGKDAVIICLGPTSLKDDVTLVEGCSNIVEAMKKEKVARVIFISAAGVSESWKQIPISSKLIFKTMLRTVLDQHKKEEEIFAKSGLDWTAVRAAVLTNKAGNGKVIASNEKPNRKIAREDLAVFLVSQIDDDQYIRQAISVTGV